MLFTIHQKRHGVKINKLQKLALISPYTALKSNKGRETECVSRGVLCYCIVQSSFLLKECGLTRNELFFLRGTIVSKEYKDYR